MKKKDNIDRSTLYSFDGPFQLLHADVGNLEFLGKFATNPKYCLLFVDLFTSKVTFTRLRLENLLQTKWNFFVKKLKKKKKSQKTRLHTDQEFKQNKKFELNKKYNVDMFSTVVRGGKAFPAEQKLKELKKEFLDLRLSKKKNLKVNKFL